MNTRIITAEEGLGCLFQEMGETSLAALVCAHLSGQPVSAEVRKRPSVAPCVNDNGHIHAPVAARLERMCREEPGWCDHPDIVTALRRRDPDWRRKLPEGPEGRLLGIYVENILKNAEFSFASLRNVLIPYYTGKPPEDLATLGCMVDASGHFLPEWQRVLDFIVEHKLVPGPEFFGLGPRKHRLVLEFDSFADLMAATKRWWQVLGEGIDALKARVGSA